MKKQTLGALLAFYASHALAQSNPGFVDGMVLTGPALSNAIAAKADVTNGTLVTPTTSGLLSVTGPAAFGGTVSGSGITALLASPGAIGSTTPNAGAFTTLGMSNLSIWLNLSPTINTTYATGGLTNGTLIGAGGNVISFCPVLSCVTSPTSDHQRASALFWATTSADGSAEEQTVAIETIIGTGYAKPWTVSTTYAVGDNVKFSGANTVYRATTAGISASSGTGPTGTGSGILDGTVVWMWINASAIDSKVGLYNEESVIPGAGNSWVQANNVTMQPGVIPTFNINTELDFTNNSGTDCAIGVANCNSLEMNVAGTNTSTTGIHLGSTNSGAKYGVHWGIRLNGDKLASDADIEIDSSAPVGLGFNASGLGGTHATAAIKDASVGGTNSIAISGTKTSADINITTASPAAYTNSGTHSLGTFFDNSASPLVVNISGTHSAEVFNDTSTAPSSLALNGTYSLAAITTVGATTNIALELATGQKICFAGTDSCFIHFNSKIIYQVGGSNIFSVADATGNAIFKGTVTPSGAP